MRVLMIKTSSMGDVIHHLPAIYDLQHFDANIIIDWVVEESFADIVALQPAVNRIIPVKLRQWRKALFAEQTRHEWQQFLTQLCAYHYDYVIDTQGLIKSAWLGTYAKTHAYVGYDWLSIREPLASLFYTQRYCIPKKAHAIYRNRALVAASLGYSIDDMPNMYQLSLPNIDRTIRLCHPYCVFLHATSRADKCWPENEWIKLGKMISLSDFHLFLPWGNAEEYARSLRLKATLEQENQAVCIVPTQPLCLLELAHILKQAQAVIGVDTGLSHLAVALDVPTIGLYGTTYPELTGLDSRAQSCSLGNAAGFPVVEEVMTVLHQWHVLK